MKIRVVKHDPTVSGYELGFTNQRQKYADYTWRKVLDVAKREKGENALRTSLHVYGWGADGKRATQFDQTFVVGNSHDLKTAIEWAGHVIAMGGWTSARVEGNARRLFAMRGFGDRAVFRLVDVEKIA